MGEKVIISITEEIDFESSNWDQISAAGSTAKRGNPEIDSESSNWDQISKVLEEADKLDFPRRAHEEIIAELRAFRETE